PAALKKEGTPARGGAPHRRPVEPLSRTPGCGVAPRREGGIDRRIAGAPGSRIVRLWCNRRRRRGGAGVAGAGPRKRRLPGRRGAKPLVMIEVVPNSDRRVGNPYAIEKDGEDLAPEGLLRHAEAPQDLREMDSDLDPQEPLAQLGRGVSVAVGPVGS